MTETFRSVVEVTTEEGAHVAVGDPQPGLGDSY